MKTAEYKPVLPTTVGDMRHHFVQHPPHWIGAVYCPIRPRSSIDISSLFNTKCEAYLTVGSNNLCSRLCSEVFPRLRNALEPVDPPDRLSLLTYVHQPAEPVAWSGSLHVCGKTENGLLLFML